MIKVLVVEDEFMVRKLIINLLPWNEMGFTVIDEAEDGLDALKKVHEKLPDVVLMDINIPEINGLELTKKIKELNPDTDVVIITGYSSFSYAKEAISGGATDYLTKPVNTEELSSILMKIKKKIQTKNREKGFVESIQRKNINLQKESFLNQMITQVHTSDWISQKFMEFNIQISPSHLTVLIFQIEKARTNEDALNDLELWKYAIGNIAYEILMESFSCVEMFKGAESNIVVLLNVNIEAGGIYQNLLEYAIEKVQNSIKFYFGLRVFAAAGSVYNSYSDIYTSYVQALEALDGKYLGEDGSIMFYKPKDEFKITGLFSVYNKEEILVCLRKSGYNELTNKIDNIYQKLLDNKVNKNYSLFISLGLYSVAEEYANEMNCSQKIIDKCTYIDQIKSSGTIFQTKEIVVALFDSIMKCVTGSHKCETYKIVEKAKKYIDLHYADDLTLDDIASDIFISSCYLSAIFKRETGRSVVEYINFCRLKKAKEMIDSQKNVKINDLSRIVGYNDSFYFSKCFKKQYGITPSAYQKNVLD